MLTSLRTLAALTRGQRLRFALATLALVAGSALLLLVPAVSGAVVDHLAAGRARLSFAALVSPGEAPWLRSLPLAALLIALLTAAAGALAYLRGRWSAEAAEGVAVRLRDRIYDHLNRLPASYHDRADTGDLVQRATSDVETVRAFLAVQVIEIGRAVCLVVAVLPLMLALDPAMTAVSLASIPLLVVFAVQFFGRARRRFQDVDEAEGALTSYLHENLTGVRVVRAFGREEFERDRFGEHNRAYRDRSERLLRLLARYWAVSDVVSLGQLGLTLSVGVVRCRDGSLSVGALFAFLSYLHLLLHPVRQMGRILSDSSKAVVAWSRIGEVLAEPTEDGGGGAIAGGVTGHLALAGVGFGYRPERRVLDGFTLEVRSGETLALVGPPGSGKTTLVSLLLRLYDYQEGSIRLDGVELKDLDRGFVRSRMVAVLQEPFLFSRPILDNIRIGKSGVSEAEAVAAAGAACVHDAIAELERGYQTLVGERGVTLSGGQRQRVALARALVADPAVLVLDDALSAIDTRTEERIRGAIRARRGRRTTLIIAHRLSTIAAADRIAVVEGGRVLELGTHQELIAREGTYRRLWRLQGELEAEIEAAARDGAREGERHAAHGRA